MRPAKSSPNIIWSIHPVLEALKTSPSSIIEIILDRKTGARIDKIIELAEQHNIDVRYDEAFFRKSEAAVGERHQGVIARVRFQYPAFPEMLARIQKSDDIPFVLLLDSIQDPQNLGAIIRTAVAAGCRYLILPKDRSAQIAGTVAKASAGAVFHIDICRVTNLVSTINALKGAGIWVFGTSVAGARSIYQADFSVPACLIIGNEEKGIRPLVKKNCDMLVTIPMSGRMNSLNASVAAGIILFEIARQRNI
ncbi:MAG: 23S rRNA (guanosine(2251)-2'-O)-methyltransferase RlmB [Deltaproteobacteria bacterium]|nr:23S rRNA (guanosine(2251)-2'-O)-methyltransferase RlmB [Deltaproteobacteria bacterium]